MDVFPRKKLHGKSILNGLGLAKGEAKALGPHHHRTAHGMTSSNSYPFMGNEGDRFSKPDFAFRPCPLLLYFSFSFFSLFSVEPCSVCVQHPTAARVMRMQCCLRPKPKPPPSRGATHLYLPTYVRTCGILLLLGLLGIGGMTIWTDFWNSGRVRHVSKHRTARWLSRARRESPSHIFGRRIEAKKGAWI